SNMGVQISVSRPLHFRKIAMLAEQVPVEGNIKGGERLVVLCDNVRLGVMAHAEQPAVRITLARLALGEKVRILKLRVYDRPMPVSESEIRWGSYDVYEGPFFRGAVPFVMPANPCLEDQILATITAAEGGHWNAIN